MQQKNEIKVNNISSASTTTTTTTITPTITSSSSTTTTTTAPTTTITSVSTTTNHLNMSNELSNNVKNELKTEFIKVEKTRDDISRTLNFSKTAENESQTPKKLDENIKIGSISTDDNKNETISNNNNSNSDKKIVPKPSTISSTSSSTTSTTTPHRSSSSSCSKCHRRSKVKKCNIGVQCKESESSIKVSSTSSSTETLTETGTPPASPLPPQQPSSSSSTPTPTNRDVNCTRNGLDDFKYGKFFRIEVHPNGGASVVHLYQDEINSLSTTEMDELVEEFFKVVFGEDENGFADHVMGIVHDAASYLPDLLEHMAENYANLTVKAGVMGRNSDIETCSMREYNEQVVRNYSQGTFRYGPLHQISLVGKVHEEVGGYFPDLLERLEKNPFLYQVSFFLPFKLTDDLNCFVVFRQCLGVNYQ